MHIPRFYFPQPLTADTTVELSAAASHHVATVLRMKVGRHLLLFNGMPIDGRLGEFSATVEAVSKKCVLLTVSDFIPRQTESPLAIELGVCLIKNDRMDWLLQKATELGVATVTPLLSEYTDVKLPADRLEKKHHHWQQVMISACEQSGRTAVPSIRWPQPIDQWLTSVEADKKWVLHPSIDSQPLSRSPQHAPRSAALLIGPEGGLSDDEVACAQAELFSGLVIGPRILRAETAPLAAITLLQHYYGDSH